QVLKLHIRPRDGFRKSARTHPSIRELRRGKPRHAIRVAAQPVVAHTAVTDIAINESELAVDIFTLAGLPGVAVAHDFIVVTADEIPPHEDFFSQWFATNE